MIDQADCPRKRRPEKHSRRWRRNGSHDRSRGAGTPVAAGFSAAPLHRTDHDPPTDHAGRHLSLDIEQVSEKANL
jgi:hypothetical protein